MDFTTKQVVPVDQMMQVARAQGIANASDSGIGQASSIGGNILSGFKQGLDLTDTFDKIMEHKEQKKKIATALGMIRKDESIPDKWKAVAETQDTEEGLISVLNSAAKEVRDTQPEVPKPDKPLYYTDTGRGITYRAGDETRANVTDIPANADVRPLNIQGQDIELTDADRKSLMPLAKALVEGRATPGQMVNARGMAKQKITMLAAEIDPNFDFTQMPTRQKVRNDFAPNGTMGKALTSLNTVIGHLDTMGEAANKLNNKALVKYNSLGNYISKNIGNPEVTNFNAARNLVIGELGKIAQGTGVVTNEERTMFQKDLENSNSIEQINGVVNTYMDLIKSRTDAIKGNWTQTFPMTQPPIPFINEKAKAKLIKHGYDPISLEKKEEGQQGSGGATPQVGQSYNGAKITNVKRIK